MTVLSDGSTDVSVCENEIVYSRFSIKGVIFVYFLRLIALRKADDQGIFGAIQTALIHSFPNSPKGEIFKKNYWFRKRRCQY